MTAARIADWVVCPHCRGALAPSPAALVCGPCDRRYPLVDGVARLAVGGTAETWGREDGEVETSRAYQEQYRELGAARDYNRAYQQRLFKRMSTAREFALLERHLASQGHVHSILDLPCGGGRLSPALAPHTDVLLEADIAEGQLRYGMQAGDVEAERLWFTASAFHVPVADRGVDGVVCCRLSHHLPTAEERERLVRELLRVARRFVIMTFFDHHSPKNLLRRIRRPIDRKPPKMTMTVSRVRELARENGGELVAWPALSWLNSGHRYALIEMRER